VLSSAPLRGMRLVNPSKAVKGSYFPALYFEREGVRFVVVHLRPPVNEDGSAGRTTMGDTSPIRKAELDFIFNTLRGEQALAQWLNSAPLIVVGDFNEDDEHQAITFCKEIGMNDALMLTGQHTHWWPLWKIPLTEMRMILRKRIDHILFTAEHLIAEKCEVLQGYEGNASDHLPCVAKLKFRRQDEPKQSLTVMPNRLYMHLSPGTQTLKQNLF
jgi:endonuclease/exonuclease/phosphatase family metal-dependent hydrolase